MLGEEQFRAIPEAEFRADVELGTFDGYASAFRFVDSYGTAFLPGAFRKTIKDWKDPEHADASRIPAVYFHNTDALVGPLSYLKEDQRGLKFSAKAVDDGMYGTMVLAHLRANPRSLGMSFAFQRVHDRPATERDSIDLSTAPEGMTFADVRAITEVRVSEISVLPATMASQPKAVITDVRSRLPSLMDALRAGDLTDEDTALLEQIVDAWNERAAAGTDHGTPVEARRRIDVELDMLLLELGEAA